MLEIIAFCCGALVMVLEMVGARVLAPHVGTSAVVWTSLIGVVLACLALGAWLGGRLADRHLSRRGLALILLGASLGSALAAGTHRLVGGALSAAITDIHLAAMACALGILALPALCCGMISPYIIRLRIRDVATSGATVGRLYALSTAGSIAGTFLGGFVLISFFASGTILWGVALGLLLLSLPAEPSRPWGRLALLCLLLLLAVWDRQCRQADGPLMVESPYNCMVIHEGRDRGRPVRVLSTDPGYSQSGMYLDDPDELYFDYTRFYALAVLARPQARDILMLGGGGGSVPKWLLSGRSGLDAAGLRLTVVELDPGMTAVARHWFLLPGDDPRLRLVHADARTFLNRQREQYDLLLVDVFNSCYSIPFHLGTQEAFAAMRRALRPGGVLAMNVIAAVEGEDGRLLRAIHAGLRRHFARVEIFCVTSPRHPGQLQNLMVLAFSQAATAAALRDAPGLRRRWRPCWPAAIVRPCRRRSPCATISPRWSVSPCRCCAAPEPDGPCRRAVPAWRPPAVVPLRQAVCGPSRCPRRGMRARGRPPSPVPGPDATASRDGPGTCPPGAGLPFGPEMRRLCAMRGAARPRRPVQTLYFNRARSRVRVRKGRQF